MKNKHDAIDCVYKERERLIILGLTGRTGAGCSTVAKILSTESFNKLNLRSYKTCDYQDADERKYSYVYRFMKEGKRWEKFVVIDASSVILSFILSDSYARLDSFIDELGKKVKIPDKKALKDGIHDVLQEECVSERDTIDIRSRKSDDITCDEIDYFLHVIPKIKRKFIEEVKNVIVTDEQNGLPYDFYTFFMQNVGNNLRSSGKYYDGKVVNGKETVIAQAIDNLTSSIIKANDKNGNKTRICIDALRNSMEVQFFRDRYRPFYCVAVNAEYEDRQNRLGFSKEQMSTLDKVEYPEEKAIFYHQNIQACLQVADIYLYNPDVSNNQFYDLTEQILKYIALMLHPGLIAPTHLERCMQLAFNAKYNSGCLSRQVGAVVTGDDYSVRSVGWNDVPKGQVPCNLRCVEDYCRNRDKETFSEYELDDEVFNESLSKINNLLSDEYADDKSQKGGMYYRYCFKDVYNSIKRKDNQVHTRALHAEENAFLQISKYGGAKIQGGKLFTTASPCELCSKKAYQLGIKEIYYIDPYPGISKTHILSFGETGNPNMIFFKGAIGNAYISLYSPRMPYKDEIELFTGIKVKAVLCEDDSKDDTVQNAIISLKKIGYNQEQIYSIIKEKQNVTKEFIKNELKKM